ncbi:MAG: hypothetical protein P8N02_19380, partial [Actinomycetota bacterium]|nr:hypothetical protein [Actinomycetota bacterium]
SKEAWRDVDDFGSSDLPPGRFVAGTTDTSIGPVRVMGVCISWHMANVKYGNKDKRPWEDHLAYCSALPSVLEQEHGLPLVMAGDYNQRIPSPRPNRKEALALGDALAPVTVLTAGEVDGCEKPGIDHISVVGLEARSIWGWPNLVGGVRCSDHDGVAADLSLEG